ncbi:MAG TPA: gamma-glutamylcyclotransferase family protein [Terracidiphilus sp.]|jgi:gamma-glutamylcyclotransferase (GGCT)/AIG2-like uncharacterized protein YtfP|nr:gamma-glutamylcyclotransferase family protein [Terracidiphilus sp.]
MSTFLFAYGTLKAGLAPRHLAHVVARLRRSGQGTVAGTIYDLGDYPGAVLDAASEKKFYGTVFEVPEDPELWRELDAYEEYEPDLPAVSQFVRVRTMVQMIEGGSLECWIYVYNRDVEGANVIQSGAWKKA